MCKSITFLILLDPLVAYELIIINVEDNIRRIIRELFVETDLFRFWITILRATLYASTLSRIK